MLHLQRARLDAADGWLGSADEIPQMLPPDEPDVAGSPSPFDLGPA
jgi:hypothetical protein